MEFIKINKNIDCNHYNNKLGPGNYWWCEKESQ